MLMSNHLSIIWITIWFTVKFCIPKQANNTNCTRTVRHTNNDNLQILNEALHSVPWQALLLNEDSIDEMVCCFHNLNMLTCLYRSPDSDLKIFNEQLLTFLGVITKRTKKFIILAGDFNINLVKTYPCEHKSFS